MRGLLGRETLPSGEGIVLRPAWSIHTAFMRFPIDVVFIDSELVVMRIEENLRSFKTASCRGAREVVELPAGECERRGLEAGDRIAWASRNIVNDIATQESPALQTERKGTVLVASGDQRFVKLSRFLLEGKGIAVGDQSVSAALEGSLEDADVDAVLLDGATSMSDGLRALTAARAQRPELPMVLVAETPGPRPPESCACSTSGRRRRLRSTRSSTQSQRKGLRSAKIRGPRAQVLESADMRRTVCGGASNQGDWGRGIGESGAHNRSRRGALMALLGGSTPATDAVVALSRFGAGNRDLRAPDEHARPRARVPLRGRPGADEAPARRRARARSPDRTRGRRQPGQPDDRGAGLRRRRRREPRCRGRARPGRHADRRRRAVGGVRDPARGRDASTSSSAPPRARSSSSCLRSSPPRSSSGC